eukprot:scaffold30619_cov73-Skeletonema_marinoi.AAC.1
MNQWHRLMSQLPGAEDNKRHKTSILNYLRPVIARYQGIKASRHQGIKASRHQGIKLLVTIGYKKQRIRAILLK